MSFTRNAVVGSLVGAGIGSILFYLKRSQPAAEDLGEYAGLTNLHNRSDLLQILQRFRVLASVSAQANAMYTDLITDCNDLLAYEDARGRRQIEANRLCVKIINCARKLSKQAVRSNDLHLVPLTSDVEELEAIVNNFLHNIMLR